MGEVTYNPAVFEVRDEDAARRIILTPDQSAGTEERWRRETPYIAALVGSQVCPRPESEILDYGCGIGRLSRALIEMFGCRVIGVDISESMRRLAVDYVQSDRFEVVSPETFEAMVTAGRRVDGALAVWVLQHCLEPAETVDLIARSLSTASRLLVTNTHRRFVPAVEKPWASDGKIMLEVLEARLRRTASGELDERFVGAPTAASCFWATFAA